MNSRNRVGKVEVDWQRLSAAMLKAESVHRVKDLPGLGESAVPSDAGVYAFWWMGSRRQLMNANRHIVLKGPGGNKIDVQYHDWWPDDAPYPCLYIGKTTNLKRRFGQHLLRRTAGRAHQPLSGNHKAKPRTTACQLRFGIEHVFPAEANPLALIKEAVGFSWYAGFDDNQVAERFFAEDRLVGHLRPWFNIDSER
jgi:hypothetical protein